MGFVFFWVGSIVLSVGVDLYNGFRMFKDAADQGYLIDIRRYSEYQRQMMPEGTNYSALSLLIPVMNFFTVTRNITNYNDARPFILNQLSMMDCVDEMTEEEKEKYAKNPTGVRAFYQGLKREIIALTKPLVYNIDNEEEHGAIYYKLGKKFEDIKVVKLEGDAKKYSKKEASQIVLESVRTNIVNIVQDIVKDYFPDAGTPEVEFISEPSRKEKKKMKEYKEIESDFADFLTLPESDEDDKEQSDPVEDKGHAYSLRRKRK